MTSTVHLIEKEAMSLTGLIDTVEADPQLKRALRYAALPGADGAELVAPPALRPVLVAALAAAGGERENGRDRGRFVLAVTATAREAEDLSRALSSLAKPGSACASRKAASSCSRAGTRISGT